MAEQCSQDRREGAHCLSEASLCTAGFGEPHREPEGSCHGQHGFSHFCRNKSGSATGSKPGNTNNYLGILDVKTEDGFPIITVGNDEEKMITKGILAYIPLCNWLGLTASLNSKTFAILSRNSQLGIKKVLVAKIHAFVDATNFFNFFKGCLVRRIGDLK